MKIKTTYDVYCYRYSNGEYKYSQVDTGYNLIDNDVNIYLGDLSFEKHRNEWSQGDENAGIVYNIYYDWLEFSSYYEKQIDELKEKINSNYDDILDDILEQLNTNEVGVELKNYINNDINKLKSLLLLLIDEFTDKHPSELYTNKITETIYDEEYDRVY